MGFGALNCCRRVAASGTYLWGGLARIDILDAPVSASLAFYGPRCMRVAASPLADADVSGSVSALSSMGQSAGSAAAGGSDAVGAESAAQEPQAADSDAAPAECAGREDSRLAGTSNGSASISASPSAQLEEPLFGAAEIRERGGLCIVKEVGTAQNSLTIHCLGTCLLDNSHREVILLHEHYGHLVLPL